MVERVPVAQVTWLRFVGHVVFSAVVLWPFALQTVAPLGQALAADLTLGAHGGDHGLQFRRAADISSSTRPSPSFFSRRCLVAALAGPLLNEWVGWHRMIAILAGFLGVLLVVHPGIGTVHWAMLLALVATLGYALYNLATRYLAAFDPAVGDADLYAARRGCAFGSAGARRVALARDHDAMAVARLARLLGRARPLAVDPRPSQRAGAGAGAVHLSRADLDVDARLSVFGNVPTLWTLSGAAIVILSGLYLLARERKVLGASQRRPRLRYRHASRSSSVVVRLGRMPVAATDLFGEGWRTGPVRSPRAPAPSAPGRTGHWQAAAWRRASRRTSPDDADRRANSAPRDKRFPHRAGGSSA